MVSVENVIDISASKCGVTGSEQLLCSNWFFLSLNQGKTAVLRRELGSTGAKFFGVFGRHSGKILT
jgi:hypothetical protein